MIAAEKLVVVKSWENAAKNAPVAECADQTRLAASALLFIIHHALAAQTTIAAQDALAQNVQVRLFILSIFCVVDIDST